MSEMKKKLIYIYIYIYIYKQKEEDDLRVKDLKLFNTILSEK